MKTSSFGIIDGKWVGVEIPPSSFLAMGRTIGNRMNRMNLMNRNTTNLPPTMNGVLHRMSVSSSQNDLWNNEITKIPPCSFYAVGQYLLNPSPLGEVRITPDLAHNECIVQPLEPLPTSRYPSKNYLGV